MALAPGALHGIGRRSRTTLADRLRRLRGGLLLAAQAGVAAGLSWLIAHDLIGRPRPFFAPIAAVIVLNVSVGQRLRRAIEFVVGVALGILVGDLLIYFIGTGFWQVGATVALAVAASIFLGGGATVIGQAASSAVLIATLAPPQRGIYYPRFIDSLIGGAIGVLVMVLLIQLNPLTLIRKAARPVFDDLVHGLRDCATALEHRRKGEARVAVAGLGGSEREMAGFRAALADARETAALAPVRWRTRAPLAQYLDAAGHLDDALGNALVLARRAGTVLRDHEPVPELLLDAIRELAGAIGVLRRELAVGEEPVRTRQAAVGAVRTAGDAYRAGLGFSGAVVVAQVRTIGHDLLLASGMPDAEAARAIRAAVGPVPAPTPPAG